MTTSLPRSVSTLITHFKSLRLGKQRVKTPYFMRYKNSGHQGAHYALSGKGRPEDIESLANEYARAEKFDFDTHTPLEIRSFLLRNSLGIDCSGLAMWLLDAWLQEMGEGRVWERVSAPRGLICKLKFKLRPENNINTDMLTSEPGSRKIQTVLGIRSGDLIRTRAGRHVLFVTATSAKAINYLHSTRHYGDDNGIIEGMIEITKPTEDLADQNWLPEHGDDNQAYKGYKTHPADNGVWRLKALDKPLVAGPIGGPRSDLL